MVVADTWRLTVKHLARAVRERRLSLDLTQVDLARIADVSLRRVQSIESESEAVESELCGFSSRLAVGAKNDRP